MKDLSDLRIYQHGVEIGEGVWEEVSGWEKFAKWTVGKQLVDSADGIASSMIEGYYRYSPKDQARFFRYSLSSAKETMLWWWRGKNRKIISSPLPQPSCPVESLRPYGKPQSSNRTKVELKRCPEQSEGSGMELPHFIRDKFNRTKVGLK